MNITGRPCQERRYPSVISGIEKRTARDEAAWDAFSRGFGHSPLEAMASLRCGSMKIPWPKMPRAVKLPSS